METRTEIAMRESVKRCAEDALSKLPRQYIAASWPGREPSARAESQTFLNLMAKASDDRERLAWEQRLERWGA